MTNTLEKPKNIDQILAKIQRELRRNYPNFIGKLLKGNNLRCYLIDAEEQKPRIVGFDPNYEGNNGGFDEKKYALDNSNSYLIHSPVWHEGSVATHTGWVQLALDRLFETFEKNSTIQEILATSSGNICTNGQTYPLTFGQLFQEFGAIAHDYGKSSALFFEKEVDDYVGVDRKPIKSISNPDRPPLLSQTGHESLGAIDILDKNHQIHKLLKSYGFDEQAIKTISQLAGHHFDFGLLRREMKNTSKGYTIAGIEEKGEPSAEFVQNAIKIFENCPDKAISLLVISFFGADSIGKLSPKSILLAHNCIPNYQTCSDEEIKNCKKNIQNYITKIQEILFHLDESGKLGKIKELKNNIAEITKIEGISQSLDKPQTYQFLTALYLIENNRIEFLEGFMQYYINNRVFKNGMKVWESWVK